MGGRRKSHDETHNEILGCVESRVESRVECGPVSAKAELAIS